MAVSLRSLVRSGLVRGAAGTFALNVAALVLGFVVAVVLSRELGAAGYGAYAFAFTWATLLSVPAMLGLTPVLVRYVAPYRAHGRWAELRGILRRANQAVLAASVAMAAAGAVTGLLFLDLDGGFAPPFLIGLTLVPLLTLSAIRLSTLQALGHVVLARLPETLVVPGLFLALAVGAAAILGSDFSATWAIGLQAVAVLAAFALGLVLVRRLLPQPAAEARPVYRTGAWARSAGPLLVVSALSAIHLHLGTVAIGVVADATEVGIYAVAGRIAALTGFLSMAATFAIMPEVARLYATGERETLDALLPRSALVVLALSSPLALAFLLFPAPFLGVFGATFEGGDDVLRILVVGELAKLAFGYASMALAMTGFEGQVLKGAVVGAISNVVLLVALVPPYGATGAAAALVLSGVAANLVHAYLAWTRTGLYTPALRLPRAVR